MQITGAVLEAVGATRPYSQSLPITVEKLELAPPRATELLVRIEAASLCHSDLSVVDGTRPRPIPMLLGHEAAGTVEEVGSEVHDVAVGTRVVLTFLPRCGVCRACTTDGRVPCAAGTAANGAGSLLSGGSRITRRDEPVLHHLGVSAFASYAVLDRSSVVPIDNDVPPDIAAMMGCAILTGGGAVLNAGRPSPGDTVAVVGLGGVGLAALITAIGEPDVAVIAVDPIEAKRAHALELGAQSALHPDEAIESGAFADVVIESAGSVAAFDTAVALTGPGGRTVTVGLPAPSARATISPLELVAGGKSIIGSYMGSALPSRDVPMFVSRWRDGRLPVERLISARLDLVDINRALDELAEGRALRQILVVEGDR